MRIDKRFYEQIDRALAGVNLPVTVYTAGGEQVYPASPREIREEEIPTLPWEEDMAVFGSMRFLRLPNLKGLVVGLPLYLAGGQEILQLASVAPMVLDTALKETWGNKRIKSPTRFILSRMRQAVSA